MVELNIPGERVRILQMFGRRVLQRGEINWLDVKKSDRLLALILFKGTNVERNLVVEEPDAAAHNRAIRMSRRDNNAQTRREVVVLSDTVTVIPQSQIKNYVRVHDPFVLNEGREFVLLAFQNTVAEEINYLSSKGTAVKDSNRLTSVSAVEISATEVHARFERVRFPRRKVENL